MIPQTRSGFSVLESAGVMWRQEFLMLLSAVTATDGLQDAIKQPVAYADTQLQGSAGNSDGPQFFLQDIVLLKKIGSLKRTCPNSFCMHPHDWSKVAMFVSRLKHHSSIGRLLIWWTPPWTLATQELLSSFEVVLDQEATMKCAEKIFGAVGAAKMEWFLATWTWGC